MLKIGTLILASLMLSSCTISVSEKAAFKFFEIGYNTRGLYEKCGDNCSQLESAEKAWRFYSDWKDHSK